MYKFKTLQELDYWVTEQKYNRYSPYELLSVDRVNLVVYAIRVD